MDRGDIDALFLEMAGKPYEGPVLVAVGAKHSDQRNVASLQAEITPVAAGGGKLHGL